MSSKRGTYWHLHLHPVRISIPPPSGDMPPCLSTQQWGAAADDSLWAAAEQSGRCHCPLEPTLLAVAASAATASALAPKFLAGCSFILWYFKCSHFKIKIKILEDKKPY